MFSLLLAFAIIVDVTLYDAFFVRFEFLVDVEFFFSHLCFISALVLCWVITIHAFLVKHIHTDVYQCCVEKPLEGGLLVFPKCECNCVIQRAQDGDGKWKTYDTCNKNGGKATLIGRCIISPKDVVVLHQKILSVI